MRVLSSCSALLTDFEVLALLQEVSQTQEDAFRKERKIKPSSHLTYAQEEAMLKRLAPNLVEVQSAAIATLSELHRGSAHQSAENITTFKSALAEAGFAGPRGRDGRRSTILSRAEQLQIINHVPQLPVELFTIIEDLEQRFGDDVDVLLDIIRTHLPTPLTAKKVVEEELRAEEAAHIKQQMDDADDDDELMNQTGPVVGADSTAANEGEEEEDAVVTDDLIHEARGAAVDDDGPDDD